MELEANKPLDAAAFTAICELLEIKREHVQRLANTNGASGEAMALVDNNQFVRRPKGNGLRHLMAALSEAGITIKPTSFDLVALPEGQRVDFMSIDSIRLALPAMKFIEVKTATQKRVKPDFSLFFFALTEGEIKAAEVLGNRHGVLLIHRATSASLLTTVPEILARARSTTWQVSVQL
jgi:hypothetical protein